MTYQLYWGDLHSHCSISYGHGTVDQALARARQQLDFATVTGHAFWPDMPTDRSVYADIIDYHTVGFARLARNWPRLLEKSAAATEEGRFIAFPSYEWHSLKYGDHIVYAPGPDLPLRDGADLPALRRVAAEAGGFIVPHHIGYRAGYRGIDWDHFRDERSPFVEIYSLHGCSESDDALYPMLHDMGPRDGGSTAVAGWNMGYRFGVIASTDHHSAYPGSHGDGRVAVFAKELTRAALWEAFQARRVYAATGDRIDARLFVNDAWIGSTIRGPGKRRLRIAVQGSDALDRVEVLKNDRLLARYFPQPAGEPGNRYRLRITWGWGRRDRLARWNARLDLSAGAIRQVETCFAGPPVVAPVTQTGDAELPDAEDLPHEVVARGDRFVAWRSSTVGNLSMRHATTQALSLELDAPFDAVLKLAVNGQQWEHPLAELMQLGSRTRFMQGWLSEAIRVGPLVPLSECQVSAELEDGPDRPVDRYRLRVAQRNGQWAWGTPIWVEQ